MDFYLVFPTERIVDEFTIERWYLDALANEEILIVGWKRAKTPEQMAAALDDAGFITVAKIYKDLEKA